MPELSYDTALAGYDEAIIAVRRSGAADSVDRGSGGISPGVSGEDLNRLAKRSADLRGVLTAAVGSADPDLRDLASVKLLSAAAYDLALAEDLIMAGEGSAERLERSASNVLTASILREVMDLPLEGAAWASFKTVDRTAIPPILPAARQTLHETVEKVAANITSNSARAVTRAVSGALDFGLGPAQDLLSGIGQELLAQVPEGVSRFVRYAARMIQEALGKLWAAFGASAQDQIKEKTQGWFKEFLGKKDTVAAVLDTLYGTEQLKAGVFTTIKNTTQTDLARFREAVNALDNLSDRYAHIMEVLVWVMRAVGWIKTPLLAVSPWGPLAAYTVYGGVLGYSVYAGADYLDVEWLSGAWLDHVLGLRAQVQNRLGV
jgi:hypothetical protein